MTPRLTSDLLVAALLRRASAEGGSGVVVSRGDPSAGAIILRLEQKGEFCGFRERAFVTDRYCWNTVGPSASRDSVEQREWIERRRKNDPDLWIVDLNVADPERFTAETTGTG